MKKNKKQNGHPPTPPWIRKCPDLPLKFSKFFRRYLILFHKQSVHRLYECGGILKLGTINKQGLIQKNLAHL